MNSYRSKTKEFKQGQKDYLNGKDITENPFKNKSSKQYELWLDGFRYEMLTETRN